MSSVAQSELSSPAKSVANRLYPIRVPLEYQVLKGHQVLARGAGHTVYMSSSVIVCKVESDCSPCKDIEVTLMWPAQLDEKVGLKLFIAGRIVNVSGTNVVVYIVHHEFRTRVLQPPMSVPASVVSRRFVASGA